MAWIPAVVGGIADIIGGNSAAAAARRGQESANRTNILLQQRQQGWEQMMSNTEVQRRKADLEAAGFNPMLSFTSGQAASTPSVAPAHVESTTSESSRIKQQSVQAGIASAMQAASLSVMQAQARKTNAEAAVVEGDPGASASGIENRRLELLRRVQLLGAQIDKTAEETGNVHDTNERASQMFSVLKDYQEAVTRGEQLDNTERKAISDLYESMKGMKGFEKFMPMVLTLIGHIKRGR